MQWPAALVTCEKRGLDMKKSAMIPRFDPTREIPSVAARERDRQVIADAVAQFLAQGGSIRHVPEGVGVGVLSISDGAELRRRQMEMV